MLNCGQNQPGHRRRGRMGPTPFPIARYLTMLQTQFPQSRDLTTGLESGFYEHQGQSESRCRPSDTNPLAGR